MIALGLRRSRSGQRPNRDPAEKPFWITYSDLMTALMVLFMVAMAAAILAITQGVSRLEQQKIARDDSLRSCMADIALSSRRNAHGGIHVVGNSIDFGSIAEFDRRGHDLPDARKDTIRTLMSGILSSARSPSCAPWIRNVIVEGYASQEGSYLLNLNLSLQRAQRMLCILLDSRATTALSEEERKFVRRKFLVGGASFNAVKARPEESRRVEFRIEFHEQGEAQTEGPEIPWDDDAKCPIDPLRERTAHSE